MNYHIKNPAGDTIASFEHECDRNACFNAFEDYWGDDRSLERVDETDEPPCNDNGRNGLRFEPIG